MKRVTFSLKQNWEAKITQSCSTDGNFGDQNQEAEVIKKITGTQKCPNVLK